MNQSQVRLNILERSKKEKLDTRIEENVPTIEPQTSISILSDIQEETDCCSICLEEFGNVDLVTLRCGHKLHLTCYTTLVSRYTERCPLCRALILNLDINNISSIQQDIMYRLRNNAKELPKIIVITRAGRPEEMRTICGNIEILIHFRLVKKFNYYCRSSRNNRVYYKLTHTGNIYLDTDERRRFAHYRASFPFERRRFLLAQIVNCVNSGVYGVNNDTIRDAIESFQLVGEPSLERIMQFAPIAYKYCYSSKAKAMIKGLLRPTRA